MNNTWIKEQFKLSVLSPVHMGSGEDYEPTEYVVEDETLYCLSHQTLIDGLTPKQWDALSNLASQDMALQGVRKYLYERRESLIPFANHAVTVSKKFEDHYKSNIVKTGAREKNTLQIQKAYCHIHNRLPIITGSGMKGAIRTAILDDLNDGKPLLKNEQPYEGTAAKNEHNKKFQQRQLGYNKIDDDPLKLLKIGDANFVSKQGLPACEVHYAVNAKRKMSKTSAKGNNGPDQMLESIAYGHHRSFTTDWLLNSTKTVDGIRGIKDVAQLIEVINKYYLPILKAEIQNQTELNILNPAWAKGMTALLNAELENALNTNQAVLLRLGRYGGADSKTVNGVRHIKINGKNGEKPTYQAAPKTYWLAGMATKQAQNLLPFGWVALERNGVNLPLLKQFLSEQSERLKTRATKETERLKQQSEKRKIREQELAKFEAKKRELAAKEQDEKEKLNKMSEIEKAIYMLKKRCETGEGESTGAGSMIAIELSDIIALTASKGSSQEKDNCHTLASEIYKHLGIDVKKNKKVKQKIKALKA